MSGREKGRETEEKRAWLYASALLHQINFTLSHLPVTMMSFIHQFGVAMETLAGVVLVWPFCDTVCLFHNLERIEPSLPVRCSVVTPQSSASTWVVYVGGRHVGVSLFKSWTLSGVKPRGTQRWGVYQPIIWDPLHSHAGLSLIIPYFKNPYTQIDVSFWPHLIDYSSLFSHPQIDHEAPLQPCLGAQVKLLHSPPCLQ